MLPAAFHTAAGLVGRFAVDDVGRVVKGQVAIRGQGGPQFWTSPHATMLDEVEEAEEAFELLLSFVGGWPEDRLL